MATDILHPSSMVICPESDVARLPPRPPHQRQPNYEVEFDNSTLFYDVFRCGRLVCLCGPPLLNLRSELMSSDWQVNGKHTSAFELRDWDRAQRSWLHSPTHGEIRISNRKIDLRTEIGDDLAYVFRDHLCLVALSKDNELGWIQDWLEFYHRNHGVTGVVLYDNASTNYTLQELRRAVDDVRGIEVGMMVSWPFKFGPGPGPDIVWDSRYLQICALEHVRWRFLREAAGVINADIDELVLTADGRAVFDHAREAPSGVLQYHGRWVEKATVTPLPQDRRRRYRDYYHYDPTSEKTTAKWTLIPCMIPDAAQWRLHGVAGVPLTRSAEVLHRHFQGINTNWRYSYAESVVDKATLVEDEQLRDSLDATFGRRRRLRRLRDRRSRLIPKHLGKLLSSSSSGWGNLRFGRSRHWVPDDRGRTPG